MVSSLDSLTNNLVKGGKILFDLSDDPEEYKLLTRKGVCPYEYMDSWDRFKETSLPSIDKFFSKLNGIGISEEDYEHATKVWKEFNVRNLGEYHDLYLQTDVMLLANVFEEFRNTCMKHYSLDPANFYTSPGLAWKACLKKTGIKLELLTDPDMLLMFQRGIRGKITQSVHRYVEVDNKYMDKFDPEKPSSYIQYLDANNLYGWAMSQPLPTGGFKWVNIGIDQVRNLSKKEDYGYILEVDVKYPTEIHDSHNELPFICERLNINGVTKLVPNLKDKSKYVVHIKALAQALDHGLILERIHRAIEFKQSAWMKPYIDFNTKLRATASNDFQKDFHKLMNNSVFGKTMENIRKHRDIKLVSDEDKFQKTVKKPNFKTSVLLGENLMGCEMEKIKVVMNKPVYLGQAILDLSKLVMYEFHYDYMRRRYDSQNLKLCYMDTDCLVYHIKTEDFYADIAKDFPTRFETSVHRSDSPLPIGLNKK